MMELATDDIWAAPTGAGHWQVRDVFGHLVDTTEGYFVSFNAARGTGEPPENLGVRDMAKHIDRGAQAFRGTPRQELVDRLGADLARFRSTVDELTDEEWAGLLVPHKYMGPLPAAFYPLFQLVDYGVHSWDIREGTGRAHVLHGDSADLLVPLAMILWQATHEDHDHPDDTYQIGIASRTQRRVPCRIRHVGRRGRRVGRHRVAPGRLCRVRPCHPGADRLRTHQWGHRAR